MAQSPFVQTTIWHILSLTMSRALSFYPQARGSAVTGTSLDKGVELEALAKLPQFMEAEDSKRMQRTKIRLLLRSKLPQ
jgi:hypothetical protein